MVANWPGRGIVGPCGASGLGGIIARGMGVGLYYAKQQNLDVSQKAAGRDGATENRSP